MLTNAWNHAGQHQYGTYIQDQYVSDLHNAMGGYSPHGLYAHVYINGLYWGMYYVHERPDHSWAAQMFGGEKEEYDALRHNTGIVINDGLGGKAANNFNAMVSAANKVASEPGNMAQVRRPLPDAGHRQLHHGPPRPLVCDELGLAREELVCDASFPGWSLAFSHLGCRALHGVLEYRRSVIGLSVSGIHDKLKANPDYRMHFADVVHRHLFNGGTLTYPHTADMYRARMAQIDRAIVGESARWGDTRSATPHTREDWLTNQNNVLTRFIQPRSTFVLNWLKNAGLYPNVDAPVFHINGTYQHGGHVDAGAAPLHAGRSGHGLVHAGRQRSADPGIDARERR